MKTPRLDRRSLLLTSVAGAAAGVLARAARAAPPAIVGRSDPFELPDLPWGQGELAPHVSATTIGLHHGAHHAGSVRKLNAAVRGTALAELDLESLVRATANDPDREGVFQNAAQSWNHGLYWRSMQPSGGGEPGGALREAIDASFGGFAELRDTFATAAKTLFGSGWVWLVRAGEAIAVRSTSNAGTPLAAGEHPLLVIDVWEHAYYLDHQNERARYVDAWLDHLVSWDFAAERFAAGD